ncbi:hypothetical protein C8J57DRAFT_1245549 [Mycena rebaudengoi]|nr:hypothetical protein C8J57DRAFT_1245549 [Mycena rebaudengoi]
MGTKISRRNERKTGERGQYQDSGTLDEKRRSETVVRGESNVVVVVESEERWSHSVTVGRLISRSNCMTSLTPQLHPHNSTALSPQSPSSLPTPAMPLPRRLESDTTHVSDSELERQAARAKAHRKSHKTPSRSRATSCSNLQEDCQFTTNKPNSTLEAHLTQIEREVADLRAQRHAVPKNSPSKSASTMDKCVGGDNPIGALDPPLIALSAFEDAVQVEVKRQLAGAHEALDEIIRDATIRQGINEMDLELAR